jgi:hypothetical protein
MCISVDLQVEVKSREVDGSLQRESQLYILSFRNSNGGDTSVSFLQGKRIYYNSADNKGPYVNSLTTDYATANYRDVIDNRATTELFGIASIDINYQSWMVPVITIHFSDIRGISLFSPEELRHTENFGEYTESSINDIPGSFFKSFFMFPYPKYTLKVKGIYGEPVSYELTLSDFRNSFKSDNGNYEATATFVGYTFSLLNDVSLNALIAAPFSPGGMSYWNEKGFTFDDGTNASVPKMLDLLNIIDDINSKKNTLSNTDPLKKELDSLSTRLSDTNELMVSYDEYIKEVNSIAQNYSKTKNDDVLICNNPHNGTTVILLNNKNGIVNVASGVQAKYDTFVSFYNRYRKNYSTNLRDINSLTAIKFDPISGATEIISSFTNGVPEYNTTNTGFETIRKIDQVKNFLDNHSFKGYEKVYAIYTYDNNLYTDIWAIAQNTDGALKRKQEEQKKKIGEENILSLGFQPTVQNVTHMIMCHLDTLMHMIENTIKSIGTERTAAQLGVSPTNLDVIENYSSKNGSVLVGPFPAYRKEKITPTANGDIKNYEDVWFGDDASKFKEAQLIEDLLIGIQSGATVQAQMQKKLEENARRDATVSIPLGVNDIINTVNNFGSPFSYQMGDNLADFAGHLIDRLFVLNAQPFISRNSDDIDNIAIADAANFNKIVTNPSEDFVEKVTSLKGVITPDLIINIAANNINDNNVKQLKNSSPFPWGDTSIIKDNGTTLVHNLYGTNKDRIPTVYTSYSQINNLSEDVYLNKDRTKNNTIQAVQLMDYVDYNNKYKGLVDAMNQKDSVKNIGDILYNKNLGNSDTILSYEDNFVKYLDTYYNKDIIEHISGATETYELGRITRSYYVSNIYGLGLSKAGDNDLYNVKRKKFDNNQTLFEDEYFKQQESHLKALLFLDNFCGDKFEEKEIFNSSLSNIYIVRPMPKYFALLAGAYLYRAKEKLKFTKDKNGRGINNIYSRFVNNTFIRTYQGEKWSEEPKNVGTIFNLTEQMSDKYIELFESWFVGVFIDKILPTFSETGDNKIFVGVDESKKYKKLDPSNDFVRMLSKDYLDGVTVDFSNPIYRSVALPVFMDNKVVNTRTNWFNGSNFTMPKDKAKKYITSFISELRNIYTDNTKEPETTQTNELPYDDIKNELYKYIKNIYDRWICGNPNIFNQWSMSNNENVFKKNFHFIDSFYNKIGQATYVDLSHYYNIVTNSLNQGEYTLLSFLTDLFAKSRFTFMSIQNYSDLSDEGKMRRMFTPIPFNKQADAKPITDFIVLYNYETAKNPYTEFGGYKYDSFMIGGEEDQLPVGIKGNSGERIPAFGVNFGKQYQSYFRDIQVDNTSPIPTEQALRAMYNIANVGYHGDNNTGGATKTRFVGQDLYTIYSNNAYVCTITMLGCAWVQPLMYFALTNIPMYRGSYMIFEVSHHIEPGIMTTTFKGQRMSKIQTPKIQTGLFTLDDDSNIQFPSAPTSTYNGGTGNQSSNLFGCDYKVYPTDQMVESYDTIDPFLVKTDTNVGWLESGVKNKNKFETVFDVMCAVVNSESDAGDKLARGLVLTTILNRYFDSRSWKSVFTIANFNALKTADTAPTDVQNEVEDALKRGLNATYSGLQYSPTTPVYICGFDGAKTNNKTTSGTVKTSDLQKISSFVTSEYYGDFTKKGADMHRKAEFILQHRNTVYTGTKPGIEPSHWSKNENRPSNEKIVDTSSLSVAASGLLNALVKTMKSYPYINTKITVNGKDDYFELTAEDNKRLSYIFDILLNGYYSNIRTLYWVKNDMGDTPNSLFVWVEPPKTEKFSMIASWGTPNGREVAYVTKDYTYSVVSKGNYTVVRDHTVLPEAFYSCLGKKYGDIGTTGTNKFNVFKAECKNFVNADLEESMRVLGLTNSLNCDYVNTTINGEDAKLSLDYSLQNFIRTDNLLDAPNYPNMQELKNLKIFCRDILQPITDAFGKGRLPISSGFRGKELNTVVKGKSSSHHLDGLAADIDYNDGRNMELFNLVKTLSDTKGAARFRGVELYLEGNGSWVHIGYNYDYINNVVGETEIGSIPNPP